MILEGCFFDDLAVFGFILEWFLVLLFWVVRMAVFGGFSTVRLWCCAIVVLLESFPKYAMQLAVEGKDLEKLVRILRHITWVFEHKNIKEKER